MKIFNFCLALIWFVFLGWIVFRADSGTMPHFLAGLYNYPGGDKIGHFFLMGSLALLINLAFPAWRLRACHQAVPAGSLLTAAVITLEECSQVLFPTRTFSLADLTADYLGIIIIGIILFHFIQKLDFSALKKRFSPLRHP